MPDNIEIIREIASVPQDAQCAAEEESMPRETEAQSTKLSMEYILARIDQIMNDTAHIHSTLKALQELNIAGPGDIGAQGKSEALATVVGSREDTNQKLIALLSKMYDDIKPKPVSEDMLKLQQLADILCRYPGEFAEDTIRKAAQQMFVKTGAAIVK